MRLHFQTCDLARVLRRLALRIVKICRNRNHRLVDLLTKLRFRIRFDLRQNKRRNLFRRIPLVPHLHLNATRRPCLDVVRKPCFVALNLSSLNLRPIRRFTEKIVFFGFVTDCRFASNPTNRSPTSKSQRSKASSDYLQHSPRC